jgi:hypothetical protein
MAAQEAGQLPEPISVGGVEIRGVPEDWTHHRLVFSNPGTESEAIAAGNYQSWLKIVNDPRYIIQQLKRGLPAQGPFADDVARIQELGWARPAARSGANDVPGGIMWPPVIVAKPKPGTGQIIKKDWSKALGATTAPSYASYPAKWSFVTSSASCNDFVIFPTGQAGATTRATLIAYYDLYSTGCGGTVPQVDWAYNTGTGATVALAPVYSIGGSQMAFVQTSSSVASLVLLTFPLTPPGTGTLTSPTAPTSVSATNYYNSGSGCTAPCMTSIAFSGGPNDTTSSPFYDYSTDSLYVGDNSGKLHKFNPVFKGTPAEVTASGWPLTVNTHTEPLSSPVYDGTTACVFVGDTITQPASPTASTNGGYLYSVNSGNSGTVCTSSTASKHGTSGQLDEYFGIQDAPLVDSTAGKVYVFAGYDTGGNNGVFQFATNFTSGSGTEKTVDTGGDGQTTYQLDGTFDNTYYTSSTPSSPSGYIYMCGTLDPATLYQIPISSNTMGNPATGPSIGTSGTTSYYGRCSPITEFFNSYEVTANGNLDIVGYPTGTGAGSWVGLTVQVGTTTYTFETSLTAVNQVLLVTSGTPAQKQDRTAMNLEAAIDGNSAQCYTGAGCLYTGQAANTSVNVSATTLSTAEVLLYANTPGTVGDFTISSSNIADITASNAQNGQNGHDYIFMSVFAGDIGTCTTGSYNGCVLSFDVTTPSNFSTSLSAGGTLNLSAPSLLVPTSGLVIDNGVNTPAGSSQIYFETLDTAGTSPCTGICAVQASQSAP